MTRRLGLGPVFTYEWIVATRRRQLYAVRSLFVAAILTFVSFTWIVTTIDLDTTTPRELALLGANLYGAIVFMQLTMVLLIAPAITAGAVCLDKSRGTLDHLLATDLSNSEIVLGKLAVRLIPILGIVGSALPALVLTSLLGGVDPDALFGAFLITIGTSTFACALTFTLSTYGNKIHEVLCTSYMLLLAWVLALPVGFWLCFGFGSFWLANQSWGIFSFTNPYALIFAPYSEPGTVGYGTWLAYLAGCLLVSAFMVVLATLRIRVICLKQAGRGAISRSHSQPKPPARWKFWARGPKFHLFRPTLDGNPVLWREWHRTRPSRWMAVVWWFYGAICVFFSLIVLLVVSSGNDGAALEIGTILNIFQVNVGLLLLNIQAVTSLSEERMRGSLDVLMTTPVTTRQILAGKWWGAWRIMPKLLILPSSVAVFIAIFGSRWEFLPCFILLISGYGATAISLGLACATWISRINRAIAISLIVGFCFNSLIAGFAFLIDSESNLIPTNPLIGLLGSLYGIAVATLTLIEYSHNQPFNLTTGSLYLSAGIQYLVASTLFIAAWLSFNRSLGRSSTGRWKGRPASQPRAHQQRGILQTGAK